MQEMPQLVRYYRNILAFKEQFSFTFTSVQHKSIGLILFQILLLLDTFTSNEFKCNLFAAKSESVLEHSHLNAIF